jgi:hypothetical protein
VEAKVKRVMTHLYRPQHNFSMSLLSVIAGITLFLASNLRKVLLFVVEIILVLIW